MIKYVDCRCEKNGVYLRKNKYDAVHAVYKLFLIVTKLPFLLHLIKVVSPASLAVK